MKVKEIKEKLDKFQLPLDEYWILSGNAMVFYGYKKNYDLDLGCTTKLANELVKHYPYHYLSNGIYLLLINFLDGMRI